jgi:hypothetical protein
LSCNSRGYTRRGKGVFFAVIVALTSLLMLLMGRLGDVGAAQGSVPPSTTPTGFTASPLPTSDVPGNFIEVDNAGGGTSLAIDPSGLPVIAYKGFSGLKLARCNNALTCDSPLITTIDGDATNAVKMVLDGNIPIFSFVDADEDLKLARCQDAACTSSTLTTVETTGGIGEYAIALDQNHLPAVLYIHGLNYTCGASLCLEGYLKLFRCNNTACDNPTITQIDSNLFMMGIAFVIDSSDHPIITYTRQFNVSRMVICYDTTCNNNYAATVDPVRSGEYASIQLDSNDIPVIAYDSVGVKLAYCNNNTTCDNPNIEVVDSGSSGHYISLALDESNIPIIGYHEFFFEDLYLSRCGDPICSAVDRYRLASEGRPGVGTSLALSNGKVFISYVDTTTYKVMLYVGDKPPPPTVVPTATATASPTLTPSLTPVTLTSLPNSTPAPAFFATHHPTLTWNAVSWAWGYQIEIDDDPAFGSPLTAEVDANTLTYTVESELSNGAYYWHVRAKQNATDWGDWSARETIIVSAP